MIEDDDVMLHNDEDDEGLIQDLSAPPPVVDLLVAPLADTDSDEPFKFMLAIRTPSAKHPLGHRFGIALKRFDQSLTVDDLVHEIVRAAFPVIMASTDTTISVDWDNIVNGKPVQVGDRQVASFFGITVRAPTKYAKSATYRYTYAQLKLVFPEYVDRVTH